MDKSRKEYIDSLWRNTPYGEWIIAASEGKADKAMRIAEKLSKAFPFTLDNADSLLCEEIQAELNSPHEFQEYLEALDDENYNLVEFMVSRDVFGRLY